MNIQQEYWGLIKESGWNKYRISPKALRVDSIFVYTLAEYPDFNNLDHLTEKIEQGALEFAGDIEAFLSGSLP